ncbi:MAG TPA: DUF4838 domain-containing protein [Thermoguttaceae bacterium]|nr:DUF4838 domain-containing protein [Thermoguttaceae bacterium]
MKRILLFALLLPVTAGAEIRLASDGATDYEIVRAADASGVDCYAAKTLAGYLRQSTGAEFPLVTPDERAAGKPAIFVGLSEPALALSGPDPLAGLKDQGHVARSVGPDIVLYGQGVHGNLYAVTEFLENSVGWRWYSVYEEPVVPARPNLTLQPFHRTRGFDFTSREVPLRYGTDFYLQNRINMGLERELRRKQQPLPPHLVSWLPNENFVHSSFAYIPPTPDARYAGDFQWMTKRNYFETNPEFFSVDESGQRVSNLQLCFSNPGLRRELTANVREHIRLSGERQAITIDAADRPGRFCHCLDCIALEDRYGSPGGPLYDYLIELCATLQREHPATMVKTLAYRRSQTQIPPRLPAGEKLPDNLIVAFAPIEDCYFADWTHPAPRIQETYQHLKDWAAITKHLWAWIYPNPWGSGHELPVGNVGRVITNMRVMHQAGVTGIFADHHGFNSRSGWSELQAWLIYQLAQDVDADGDALIAEFTDQVYGHAGPLVRQYLAELEAGRKAMITLPPGVTYKSRHYDQRTFPYLTPENIHRWQLLFDHMEQLAAGSPRHLSNVQILRRELDVATLWKWFELNAAYPTSYVDHRPVAERIAAANVAKAPAGFTPAWTLGEEVVSDFVTLIESGGEKPLPAQFAGIAPDRIRTFLPRHTGRGAVRRTVKDPQAGFGLAVIIDQPGDPFRCGFSQWKSRVPNSVLHGPKLELSREQITPGEFRLYRLGEINLTTDDSLIWFGRSWATHLEIGSRLYFPGEENRWEAWISLKFTGETYGGEVEDLVVCDRVILVKHDF